MDLKAVILIVLFVVSGVWYYNFTISPSSEFKAKVVSVIDGDTLILENGQRVRLKGINTPEKNQIYFDQARIFLEENVANKTVTVHSYGVDKYNRTLGYIFIDSQNINEELVLRGLATFYEYESDFYSSDLETAESIARNNGLNLWKFSPNNVCVELIELSYKEKIRCNNEEFLVLRNICDFDLQVTIKDDATHIYKEKLSANNIFSRNFSCIFNNAGDTLYISDDKGLLIFYRY